MSAREQTTAPTVTARQWRAVALPAEHGSWSFWLEPVLLGALVAVSVPGLWLALASFGVFLVHQPLKIYVIDRQRGRIYQRTRLAGRMVLIYGLGAVVALALSILTAPSLAFLLPVLLVSPLAAAILYFDLRHDSRHALPEVFAAVPLTAVAASMALAGGWSLAPALALSAVLICRAVPTIIYVRARLRLEKGQTVQAAPATLAHVLAILVIALLVWLRLAPVLSVIAVLVLLLRALYGLSRYRRPALPKQIGIQEICFGLLVVLLTAAGYMMPL